MIVLYDINISYWLLIDGCLLLGHKPVFIILHYLTSLENYFLMKKYIVIILIL